MKRVNFWKTLFLSALTVAAFTGCSNDDSDDDGGYPSITVNGAQSTSVAVGLDGGTTEAVTIESSGDWTLTIAGEDGADVADCVAIPASGKKGTSTVDFKVEKADEPRTYTATVTTVGSVFGQTMPFSATIKIMQNEDASTDIKTNVKTIRETLAFDGQAVSESTVVTGIVVSDFVGSNINNHQIMITDNTTEPGAGLMVRFDGYIGNKKDTDYNLPQGCIVSFDLKGGIAQRYKDVQYQVDFSDLKDPTIDIVSESGNMPEPITVANVADLINYQSQYVQIYSQPVEAIRGQAYYNGNGKDYANQSFQTPDGSIITLSFNSYSATWAKNETIPSNAGYIKGCVSFNGQKPTLSPNNANDLKGMTEPLFEVESSATTISKITEEGTFELKNVTVVTRSDKAFMIADQTGAMLVYGSNEFAVGDNIDISGPVTIFNAPDNTPQFSTKDATITKVSSGNAWTYEFTEYSVEDVRNYLNNVTCKAIELTGTIVKDGTYYNLMFDGVSDIQGSIQYYTPDASVLDLPVVVKGYAVGKSVSGDGAITRIKVFPYEITVNSTTPYIKATASASFKADGETIDVAFTAGNLGANKVYAKVDGAGFSVPSGEISGSTVAVTAAANEGAAREATLTIYAAASEGGEAVAQATVTLKQTGVGTKNYVPVTSAPADWSGTYVVGYVTADKSTCYILKDKKDGVSATKSIFTYDMLVSPAFDGTNIVYDAAYNTVTIAKIPGTSYYSIKYGDMYVGWTTSTGNSCAFSSSEPSESTPDYQWTPSFEEGLVVLTCTTKGSGDKSPRTLQFNSNNTQERFAVYASTQKNLTLYQLQ